MSSTADLFPDEPERQPQAQGPDLRIGSVPQLRIADDRRYAYGLGETADALLKPLHPGEFVVWGAREGHGKTSLVERFALLNSSDHRILFASLDMPPTVVQDRCLAKFLGCDLDGVELHRRDNSPEYQAAMDSLRERDFLIWRPKSTTEQTVQGLTERAEDVTAAVLIIDYCRLIRGWRGGFDAQDIVNYLANWAGTTRITTILLTQLKDEAVGKRPHNGHIQDTPQLSQRADRVVLLYRPFHGHPRRDTVVELCSTKNRRGKPCRPHVGWTGTTMDFYPLTDEDERLLTCCRSK